MAEKSLAVRSLNLHEGDFNWCVGYLWVLMKGCIDRILQGVSHMVSRQRRDVSQDIPVLNFDWWTDTNMQHVTLSLLFQSAFCIPHYLWNSGVSLVLLPSLRQCSGSAGITTGWSNILQKHTISRAERDHPYSRWTFDVEILATPCTRVGLPKPGTM